MIKVNNMDSWMSREVAAGKKFIVVSIVEGELWFYDAWNDFDKALTQAVEINGQVLPAECVEGV